MEVQFCVLFGEGGERLNWRIFALETIGKDQKFLSRVGEAPEEVQKRRVNLTWKPKEESHDAPKPKIRRPPVLIEFNPGLRLQPSDHALSPQPHRRPRSLGDQMGL